LLLHSFRFAQRYNGIVKARLLGTIAGLCTVLFLATLALWPVSFWPQEIPSDPVTGFVATPPRLAIPLPEASHAEEYIVPLHGNLERWEYAPWEHRWYRLYKGISMWPVLLVPLFAFAATAYICLANRAFTLSGDREKGRAILE
jgi:hypothetical protein